MLSQIHELRLMMFIVLLYDLDKLIIYLLVRADTATIYMLLLSRARAEVCSLLANYIG